MDRLKDGAGVRQPQVGGCPGHHSGESLPQASRAGAVGPRAWDREGHQTGVTTKGHSQPEGTLPGGTQHTMLPHCPLAKPNRKQAARDLPVGWVRADASTHSRPAAGPRQAMESGVCGRLCPELGLVWLWLAPQGDWAGWSLRCVYPPSAGPSGFQSFIYE